MECVCDESKGRLCEGLGGACDSGTDSVLLCPMLKIGATELDDKPGLLWGTLELTTTPELFDFREDDPACLEQLLSICSLITRPSTSLEHNGLMETYYQEL
jgi:hypothetical protein